MKRSLFWVMGVAFFVAALWIGWTFRAGNAGSVDLDLIWLQLRDVALWRLVLASVGLGGVFAGSLVGLAWLRVRLLNRRYRSAIRRLESELHQLRSLPLAGSRDSALVDEPEPARSVRG